LRAFVLLFLAGLVQAQTTMDAALPRAVAIRRAPGSAGGSSTSSSVALSTAAFPRILSGNNWDTTVVLINTGAAPAAFQEYFFAANGAPAAYAIQSAAITGTLTASSVQGVLAPGASLSLALSDPGGANPEGWSLLAYNPAQGAISAYAVVRHKGWGGGYSVETTEYLDGMQDYSACVPFDNTQGFATQLTLLNPAGNTSAQVRLTYLNPSGQVILLDAISLGAGQLTTLTLPDVYPDLANKTGSVLVQGDTNVLSVTGFRFNSAFGVAAALPVLAKASALPQ